MLTHRMERFVVLFVVQRCFLLNGEVQPISSTDMLGCVSYTLINRLVCFIVTFFCSP